MNTESFDEKPRIVADSTRSVGAIIEIYGIKYDGPIVHLRYNELRGKFSCGRVLRIPSQLIKTSR